jgi:integrase
VPKRSYGSGSLYPRADRRGGETWYAKVRIDGRQVKKAIGPKREPGDRDGLTRRQAEARLRKLLDELAAAPRVVERMTLEEAGQRYLTHLAALGRRRSTLMDYESYLRVHLGPCFDRIPLDKVDRRHVEAFIAGELAEGRSPKSVRNYVGLLHSIFDHAERQDWRTGNPCKLVDLPQAEGGDPDIRFLDNTELEALLRAVPIAGLGPLDRLLYLTAAMTGLRQGELLALRWRDVDWAAGRIRVRQSYVRGEFGRPKSKRSSRSVPLADRLAGELERHFQSSAWQGDDDLVFGHLGTGKPLERSRLLKRFKGNLARACVSGGALPRPAPHLRNAHGRGRHTASHLAGVDGPSRLQDNPHLRRLPALPARGRVRRAGLRRRSDRRSPARNAGLATTASHAARRRRGLWRTHTSSMSSSPSPSCMRRTALSE